MKQLLALVLAWSVFSIGFCQSQPRKPFVTRGEFYVTLNKLTAATDSLLGLPKRSGAKPDRPDALLTRAEMARAFKDTFDHFRPKFKVTPRPYQVVKKALADKNEPATQQDLELLIKWGFVAPVGPLVVGPGPNLSAKQAGDALGYFFSQLSVLTHRADPKWTPRLEPQRGG